MAEVMTSRRTYPSDLTDAQWAIVESLLPPRPASIAPARHDLREIVNAILYVARTGIAWRYLPHDFPPHTTVYDYFARWEGDGTAQRVHDALREQVRRSKGRRVLPTAAIIDAQVVKSSPNAPADTVGYDMGKRTKGRKRHIATDTLGLLLVLVITAASVQDSAGGRRVLEALHAAHPGVTKAWADGGYNNGVVQQAADHGIELEIVKRSDDVKGFQVLPRRWVVERTFGWFVQHRRLVRDYEAHPERSAAMIHWAMTDTMVRRLTHPNRRQPHDLLPKPPASA